MRFSGSRFAVSRSQSVLVIFERNPSLHKSPMSAAPVNYREWQNCRSLEGVAVLVDVHMTMAGLKNGADPQEMRVELITMQSNARRRL